MEFIPVPCVSKCQYCNEREPTIHMSYGNPGEENCHYFRCCDVCKEIIFKHERALDRVGIKRTRSDGVTPALSVVPELQ